MRPGRPKGGDTLQQLGQHAGYGITIALSTGLFAWLGLELDDRLHTGPLFVMLGAFVGFGAAFYRMYSELVLEAEDEEDERDRGARSDREEGTAG